MRNLWYYGAYLLSCHFHMHMELISHVFDKKFMVHKCQLAYQYLLVGSYLLKCVFFSFNMLIKYSKLLSLQYIHFLSH